VVNAARLVSFGTEDGETSLGASPSFVEETTSLSKASHSGKAAVNICGDDYAIRPVSRSWMIGN